ncbi:MAG: 50S ribosomal protein L19 [Oligoflexia bacterium]|nr:50S ribosomal protein L19 [Oligoflexia bacterium]
MAGTKVKYRKTGKGSQLPQKGLAAKVALVEKSNARAELPDFKPGDTVRVQVKIKEGEKERVQAYEGIVIARGGAGGSKSFVVRKISHGVGVERIFLEGSMKIAKVEVLESGRVRRAKLYYLRELVGKAAKVEREVETLAAQAASAAAKEAKKTETKK